MSTRLAIVLAVAATGVAAQQLPRLEPQATGTGAITGRVVEAGSNAPVANAWLRIQQTRGQRFAGVHLRFDQLTTDSSGAFAFRNLPAGQFSVHADADGYQPGAIGKRRPQGEEVWITLDDGQTFSNATIELFRGGTISGVVTNDRGEPLNDVLVGTWMRSSSGQLENRHGARTNGAGEYHITAVPAGDHMVVASVWHDTVRQGPPDPDRSGCVPLPPPPPPGALRPSVSIETPKHADGEWFTQLPRWISEPAPDDRGRQRTIATTIYPGVSEVSRASVVSILAGEHRTGIDLQLRPTPTTTIQGRIVPSHGKTIGRGSEVRLRLPGAPSAISEHRTWVQPDSTFRFLGVAPGPYVLELQLQEFSGCDVLIRHSDDVLTQMTVDVPQAGLDDLAVAVSSAISVAGRIRFDGRRPRPEAIDIRLTPTGGGEAKPGDWDHDARISAGGLVPGGYTLDVSDNAESPGWFVRSMTSSRLDLVTRPIAVDRNDLSGIEVTMTERPSALQGVIVDATGNIVRDATVVAFPVDRASWVTAHERLAGFARTRSLDGTYRFGHVVPGDYFVAAVDERRMGEWPRSSFLQTIAPRASRVRITAGGRRTLTLTLQTR